MDLRCGGEGERETDRDRDTPMDVLTSESDATTGPPDDESRACFTGLTTCEVLWHGLPDVRHTTRALSLTPTWAKGNHITSSIAMGMGVGVGVGVGMSV